MHFSFFSEFSVNPSRLDRCIEARKKLDGSFAIRRKFHVDDAWSNLVRFRPSNSHLAAFRYEPHLLDLNASLCFRRSSLKVNVVIDFFL